MIRTATGYMRNMRHDDRARGGFTLIEILVSMCILAVIVGIIYASLMTVINATEAARSGTEEMRVRQFLARSFLNNIGSLYIDPAFLNEQTHFIGANGKGTATGMDSLEFCASAPLNGGMAPPGSLKRVTYSATRTDEQDKFFDASNSTEEEPSGPEAPFQLEGRETPVSQSAMTGFSNTPVNGSLFNDKKDSKNSSSDNLDDTEKSATWNVPIETLAFAYYDGQKWVKEWDSMAMQRLPWAVRVQVNFPKTKEEQDAASGSSGKGDMADFDMVIPLAQAKGTLSMAPDWYPYLYPNLVGGSGGPMVGGSGSPYGNLGGLAGQVNKLTQGKIPTTPTKTPGKLF